MVVGKPQVIPNAGPSGNISEAQVLTRGWLVEEINGVEVEVLGFLNNQWHSRELCYWANDNLTLLQGKKILDIGSGHGYVPIYFKKLGLDITASEHAKFPQVALRASMRRSQVNFPIIKEWVTPEMTDTYDVVMCAKVFWGADEIYNNTAILERVRDRGGMAVMVSQRVTQGEHPFISKENFTFDRYPTKTGVDVMVLT